MLNEPQKIVSQTETTKDSLTGSRVPVTLDILLEMRFPDEVAISSDGKKVAFVVWENVPDEPKRRGRIWVADTSGFFFFQAEDGIRDGRVTGVQTCALPISRLTRHARHAPRGGCAGRPR